MVLPIVYPIIDVGCFPSGPEALHAILQFTERLLDAGATLVQLRDKGNDLRKTLSLARELRRVTLDRATLIINDRVDLCLSAQADGVHLGQDDLSPSAALKLLPQVPGQQKKLIGFSTHNLQQVRAADSLPVDYIAFGPIFSTRSKLNPDPVLGTAPLREARGITAKPLVAIGGITRQNCLHVKAAGADSVAVISDLLGSPAKAFEEFLTILG